MLLSFDEYQAFTKTTAIYPAETKMQEVSYLTLGLAGEAGEIANKVKKIIRDHGGKLSLDRAADIAEELGDVLWYLTRLADALGWEIERLAAYNKAKLESRQARGVLGGSGDNR